MRVAYERVRAAALTGEWGRWGLGVLARAGVAAWMRAWREHAGADGETPGTPRGGPLVRGASRLSAPRRPDATSGVAGGTPGVAGETAPVVTLLALMLRGMLDGPALQGPAPDGPSLVGLGGAAVRG